DRGFRFLTAFTTDRELLLTAIKDPRNFKAYDPLQIANSNLLTPDGPTGGVAGSARKGDAAEETIADIQRTITRMDESYRRTRVKQQVEMLGAVANSLQKLSGRKHIVLLSEGFDPRLVQ